MRRVRKLVRASPIGVSLPTDQRMIEARFRSRVMFSLSWLRAFSKVAAFSQRIVQ